MTDYHNRPVMSVRIDADLKEFALAEAKRPGVTLGAVVDEALADLRTKRAQVNHVVDPVVDPVVDRTPPRARSRQPREAPAPAAVFVAADPDQPQPAARRHAVTCKCGMCRPDGGK